MYDPEDTTPGAFKDYLLTCIDQLGIDAEKIATLVDVSNPSVRRWLAGETTPHLVLRKIAVREINKLHTERSALGVK